MKCEADTLPAVTDPSLTEASTLSAAGTWRIQAACAAKYEPDTLAEARKKGGGFFRIKKRSKADFAATPGQVLNFILIYKNRLINLS